MNSDEYSYSHKSDAYKEGVEEARAQIRENFIHAVRDGTMPLQEAKNLGFDVQEEMLRRDIYIPDQDIVNIRFYKKFVERTLLCRGTKELLKIYSKDDVVMFFKRAKEFDKRPIDYVMSVVRCTQSNERYINDSYYHKCLDSIRDDYREVIIRGVSESEISVALAHKLGFEVKDEMLRRGVPIPDQDLQNLVFYRNHIKHAIFDGGIKALLKIFTQNEVADYLNLIRVKSGENVDEDEHSFLERIINSINNMEAVRKHSADEVAARAQSVSGNETAKSNNDDDDDDNDEEE